MNSTANTQASQTQEGTRTVKIYRVTCTRGMSMDEQGSGYSLEPWGHDTPSFQGYDDDGSEYILPNGYHLATTKCLMPGIFRNDNDEYCDIVSENDRPVLVSSRGIRSLKAAR